MEICAGARRVPHFGGVLASPSDTTGERQDSGSQMTMEGWEMSCTGVISPSEHDNSSAAASRLLILKLVSAHEKRYTSYVGISSAPTCPILSIRLR